MFLSSIFILSIYRTSAFVFEVSAVLDIIVIIPDYPKEVTGQDVHEGDLGEVLEDKEAEVEGQNTSQPVTVAAPGETGVVEKHREVGFSYSHQETTSTDMPIPVFTMESSDFHNIAESTHVMNISPIAVSAQEILSFTRVDGSTCINMLDLCKGVKI